MQFLTSWCWGCGMWKALKKEGLLNAKALLLGWKARGSW